MRSPRGLVMALLVGLLPQTSAAQTDGSAAAAVAGGALGLFSSAILGVAGSIIPCTQTFEGAACVRWHAIGAGALGLVGGALTGGTDADRIGTAAFTAGIGLAAGGAAGLMLKPIAQRVGWHDVLAVGLLGAAIGASPTGAALGFGAGTVGGIVLWLAIPGAAFPDALASGLAGLALGGIGEWMVRAVERGAPPGRRLARTVVPIASIRF